MSRAAALAVPAPRSGAAPGRGSLGDAIRLAGPGALLLVVLLVLPTLADLVLAFHDWDLGARGARFVGFDNFSALFDDPLFWAALGNTLAYAGVVLPVTLTLGLWLAITIESSPAFRQGYRAVVLLPVLAAFPAMALAWEALLHPTIGPLNITLRAIGVDAPPNWLRDQATVLPAIMVMGIWQHLGLAVILFIGGLKGISRELYDAAEIDGAGPLDRFLTVTLPGLGPVLVFVTTLIGLRAIEMFDKPLILTGGGPGFASETILHALYVETFVYLRTGYGAALTVIFLLLAVAITMLRRAIDRRVHYS